VSIRIMAKGRNGCFGRFANSTWEITVSGVPSVWLLLYLYRKYLTIEYVEGLGDFKISKGKGKAVPLQAWSGPECSRKLRFPDFMTTQYGGKVFSLTHRPPLPPGNTPGTHFC